MQAQVAEIVYPESDGKPLADNTLQARWLVYLYTNLNALLPDFVATNLMWYPIQGNPKVALAPDILVALGRPKGDRSSYRNWEEGGPPDVVMEIRSPGNPAEEMARKLRDYDRFQVQEYYMYDPHHNIFEVYLRQEGRLQPMAVVGSFDSPLLKIRFVLGRAEMTLLDPELKPFLSLEEAKSLFAAEYQRATDAIQRAKAETKRAEDAHLRAEEERQRAEEEHQRAEEEHQRAEEEHQRAEEERQRAEEERQRAEEERQRADLAEARVEEARQRAEHERLRAERLAARLKALGLEDLD